MIRGEVIYQKQDVDGNPIGRENVNPIYDSCWYEVELDNGEVRDITENVIVERMYAHCDENGNDMLLYDSFIEYQKSERSIYLQDPQITVNGRYYKKRLTADWEIFILWKYQSKIW